MRSDSELLQAQIDDLRDRLNDAYRYEIGNRREWIVGAAYPAKGAAAPTQALRAIGGSGTVKMEVLQFSKTTQNDVYIEFHIPESWNKAQPIAFHLMWLPGSGWTAGNYVWKLEYLLKAENSAYNTGTPGTITMDVTPANATDMIETEFANTIPAAATDALVACHFYRDVASDNGDDTGDVNFFEFVYWDR